MSNLVWSLRYKPRDYSNRCVHQWRSAHLLSHCNSHRLSWGSHCHCRGQVCRRKSYICCWSSTFCANVPATVTGDYLAAIQRTASPVGHGQRGLSHSPPRGMPVGRRGSPTPTPRPPMAEVTNIVVPPRVEPVAGLSRMVEPSPEQAYYNQRVATLLEEQQCIADE